MDTAAGKFGDDAVYSTFLSDLYKLPQFPYKILWDESNRKKTFDDKSWADTEIKRSDYTGAGFYYTGKGDVIKCPYCYLKLENIKNPTRELGKMLPMLHAALSHRCKFITERVRNKNLSLHCDSDPSICEGSVQETEDGQTSFFETNPKHPSWKNHDDRLGTFSKFPKPFSTTFKERLADAGFFHNPSSVPDKVTCYWCNGSLEDWKIDDKPWKEHAKYYPGCSYLRKRKGTSYIMGVRTQMTDDELRNSENMKYSGSSTILAEGYARYIQDTTRRDSFTNCPSRQQFSRMGFHEVSEQDMMCYLCGILLKKTLSESDVELIHSKHSVNCKMVNDGPSMSSEGEEGMSYIMGSQFNHHLPNQ